MKGDKIRTVVDTGGNTMTVTMEATRDGRTVQQARVGTQIVVVERTRNGEAVRQAVFMASRVIAIIEEPKDT